jgi:glycosyltransferase involved in cell wall biosynthesis
MRKKILIVTDNLRDQINGVVTTFKNIEICADSDGYDFVYIDPRQFSYIDCPGYAEVKIAWPRGIGKRIEEINPDHIHIATEGPVGLAARIWCDRNGYFYNTSYHTKFPEFLYTIYKIPVGLTYRYVRWFHKHSGKVLTSTESMVKELLQNGFKRDIITWTRGCIDEKKINQLSKFEKKNIPTVLFVGRISKEKNLIDLCELSHIYNIIIVGDGPHMKKLKEKYKNVEFVGYKTGIELSNFYATADVFCFPSKSDTFGLVMLESISFGTPVAAYNVTGPKDVIENGINGYVGDNLKTCIDQCLNLDRSVVKKSSEKWSWENCWKIFKDNLIKTKG